MVKTLFTTVFTVFLCFVAQFAIGQVAGFTASDSAGCLPLVVHFTNTSTGATSYSWNLGNSTTTTATDASASYTSAGTYTITLTAKNGSTTSTTSRILRVYDGPVVNFSADKLAVCPGTAISFTSSSLPNAWGGITYTWSFGDGNSSTASAPVNTYIPSGLYNVTLFARNGPGCVSSATKAGYIRVFDHSVVAFTASATTLCKIPAGVSFANTTTGKAPLSYKWQFGNGGISAVISPVYTYPATGNYDVTLKVTDGNGCIDSLVKPAYVKVRNVVASFTARNPVCINAPDSFTNTGVGYKFSKWSFGDGGTSTIEHPVYAYGTAGTYTAKLVVSDSICADSMSRPISVSALPTGSIVSSPVRPCQPPVKITYTASTSSGTSVFWNFPDRDTLSGNSVVNEYLQGRIGYVEMVLTNGAGCVNKVRRLDTINSFNLRFDNTYGGCIPLAVTFFAPFIYSLVFNNLTSLYEGITYPYPITSYSWDYKDGSSPGSGPTPTHIFTASGVYSVVCTVTSAPGCKQTEAVKVSAGKKPAVTFTVSPNPVCAGSNAKFTTFTTDTTDKYRWEFGDGSTQLTPDTPNFYSYGIPNTYTVSVQGEDRECRGPVYKRVIQVDSPAAIIGNSYICVPRNTMAFGDSSLGDDEHLWTFGDGTTSTVNNLIHTFPRLDSFNVGLTTFNKKSGCRDTSIINIDLRIPGINILAKKRKICPSDQDSIWYEYSGYGFAPERFIWYVDGTFLDSADRGTGMSFEHIFKTSGYHDISIRTMDQHHCYDSFGKKNVVLVGGPTSNFAFPGTGGCAPVSVNFTDAGSFIVGANIKDYRWDFGDGDTLLKTTAGAAHTYTAPGSYSVKQIVTDSIGCKDSLIKSAAINIYKSTAFFSAPDSGCLLAPVSFKNSSTGATDYLWQFGDGATSTVMSPDHAYTAVGTYTIKMIASEPHGCADSLTRIIKINAIPNASFTVDDSFAVCFPHLVNFTNTSTGASSYLWTFGDGASSEVVSPSSPYTAAGLYTVKLLAKNTLGCADSSTWRVTIFGYAGAFSYSINKGCSPMKVSFKSLLTVKTDIIWDFGDGIVSGLMALDTISHVYTSPGSYLPKLVLTDKSGCTNFSIAPIPIKADTVLPAFSIAPAMPCDNTSTTFSDGSSSIYSGAASWLWTFPGGVTYTSAMPIHTFTSTGTFPVRLFVTDSFGCMGTITKNVTVYPTPTAITGSKGVCIGGNTQLSNGVAGGVWTSSANAVATISTSGIVSGVSAGTTTISYTVPSGCAAVATVTVYPLPAPITGVTGICAPASTTLSNITPGGTWSSSAVSVATIGSSTGVVTALSLGTTTITYKISVTGCYVTSTVAVRVPPGGISGPGGVCIGASITLSNGTAGGTWSSAHTTIATVNSGTGVVLGKLGGTATISYTTDAGCSATTNITVNPLPAAISGNKVVCAGYTYTLSDATAPGTWTSSNSGVATVAATSGLVTGATAGTATITYTLVSTGCYVTVTASITAAPSSISGASDVCTGATSILMSAGGGTWASANTGVATIGSLTGNVTAVAAGTAVITYSLPGCFITDTVTVNAPPPAMSGASSICAGTTTTFTNGAAGGTWSSGNTAVATIGSASGTVAGLLPGTALITYSLGKGCGDAVDTIKVIDAPGPITGVPNFCEGTATQLSNAIGGGKWTGSNTAIATVGSSSGLVSGVAAGTAIVTYSIGGRCEDTVVVTVDAMPDPGNISGDTTVCVGLKIQLTTTVASGIWGSSDGAIAPVSASGEVTGMVPGSAVIIYTVSAATCTTSITRPIIVFPLPDPGVISGQDTVCVGAIIKLSETETGGVWSTSNTVIATINGSSGVLTALSAGVVNAVYTVGPGTNGCNSEAIFPITVLQSATFTVKETLTAVTCFGGSEGAIITEVSNGRPPLRYLWSTGDTVTCLSGLVAGTYTLTVTEPVTQCLEQLIYVIKEPDLLVLFASVQKDYCLKGAGRVVTTTVGGSEPYTYRWSNNATGSQINNLLAGSYSVSVTDANGCTDTLSVVVGDSVCNEIIIHDVITPNGDGINDTWVIEGITSFPNNVQIFDKWGDMVYEYANYDNSWYGQGKGGRVLPDGTYFYLVKLNVSDPPDGKGAYTGAVLIKR